MADKLKGLPRVARPLTGPGRLPKLENLLDKSPDELIRTLNRFGIDPDLKAIESRANRAFGKLEQIIAEGVEPTEALWASIEKAHVREMEQSLRLMTKQAIRLYRIDKLAKQTGKLMWVAVEAGEHSCPSCEPRHGQVKTLAQWQAAGLPGSAALICNGECKCNLIPT